MKIQINFFKPREKRILIINRVLLLNMNKVLLLNDKGLVSWWKAV